MSESLLWTYCEWCGRTIRVGEKCFDIGEASYCTDCCKEVDTLQMFEGVRKRMEVDGEW